MKRNSWEDPGRRLVAVVLGVAVVSAASCQSAEQGYWTKHGVSQALTNEQYPTDSKRCERLAEQDDGSQSEAARSSRYTKCMYARGYEWVVEQSSQPAKSVDSSAAQVQSCPTGRLIVDSFGYPKCVPAGKKDRGGSPEVRAEVTAETPQVKPGSPPSASSPSSAPASPVNEQWTAADRMCRRQAQETLSNTYGIYAQCMHEKGWPSVSP